MASRVAQVIVEQLFVDMNRRSVMAIYELGKETEEAIRHEWCQIIDEVLEAASNAGKHD